MIVKTERENFEIFSQKLAGHLMKLGFVLQEIRPDRKCTGRNVFLFRDTPQLRRAVDEYLS